MKKFDRRHEGLRITRSPVFKREEQQKLAEKIRGPQWGKRVAQILRIRTNKNQSC